MTQTNVCTVHGYIFVHGYILWKSPLVVDTCRGEAHSTEYILISTSGTAEKGSVNFLAPEQGLTLVSFAPLAQGRSRNHRYDTKGTLGADRGGL